ncbi:MAG: hypothetical protein LUQ35_04785 [Methanoregula sp.]|nr:hypothetical protein [Methanoregula sp.]
MKIIRLSELLALLILMILVSPAVAQNDWLITPDPVELTVCHQGGITEGTFTFTSYYPQRVEVGIMDWSRSFPYENVQPSGFPVKHNGWILDQGESATVIVLSTAKDSKGVVWDNGVYSGWLGFSIDDAETGDSISTAREKVIVKIVDCSPSPEFPSAILPLTLIIGFLGTVLLIQRTREN